MMSDRRKAGRERGVTLAELVIALAIGAIVISGSMIFLHRMVSVADENRDKTFASLQVQFVGFWINEDVMQATKIELNDDLVWNGFPLVLTLEAWDDSAGEYGEMVANDVVIYDFEPMPGEDGLWRMYRDSAVSGKHLVAERIDPAGTSVCRRVSSGETPEDVGYELPSLWVEVAADLEGSRANSTYEIFPRTTVLWLPVQPIGGEFPGLYDGPEC